MSRDEKQEDLLLLRSSWALQRKLQCAELDELGRMGHYMTGQEEYCIGAQVLQFSPVYDADTES